MLDIKNDSLGLYGKMYQFEELGFKGLQMLVSKIHPLSMKAVEAYTILKALAFVM